MTPLTTGPVHVAITRRIKPGCEAEFQQALQEFFRDSFAHDGVQGANMLVPVPGSSSSEFGILRTFATKAQCEAFYRSSMFSEWEERVTPFTEGEPFRRELSGLEAWFRSPNPPPVWKMALLTFLAVWPVSMLVPAVLTPLIGSRVSATIFAGAVAGGIVLILTWVAMPILVRLAKPCLQPTPATAL